MLTSRHSPWLYAPCILLVILLAGTFYFLGGQLDYAHLVSNVILYAWIAYAVIWTARTSTRPFWQKLLIIILCSIPVGVLAGVVRWLLA